MALEVSTTIYTTIFIVSLFTLGIVFGISGSLRGKLHKDWRYLILAGVFLACYGFFTLLAQFYIVEFPAVREGALFLFSLSFLTYVWQTKGTVDGIRNSVGR